MCPRLFEIIFLVCWKLFSFLGFCQALGRLVITGVLTGRRSVIPWGQSSQISLTALPQDLILPDKPPPLLQPPLLHPPNQRAPESAGSKAGSRFLGILPSSANHDCEMLRQSEVGLPGIKPTASASLSKQLHLASRPRSPKLH